MLKTLITASTLLLSPNSQASQTDFDSLDASTERQIEQTQKTSTSYAIAEDAQRLRVFKHAEDSKMLNKNQQYTIYSNNLVKGAVYKITYKGDYVKSIEVN
ncbi:hypothetical protein [Staphylococcus delphini]|uniref:Uncharacterized protein n=1 Tax=Staphylococcus delphini TaxID=53344 RepID=A0AAX0QTA5_9STAP|nr:hypothetical protein [Staphylococcus delphini]PCF50151.1 hypothetical protein B5C07_08055 [Staphylococcus delphini]PNZ87891.1 hypothetical protein CD148_13120 [Staphylococcus delphini]RIZ56217.1 hypothetical protein CDL68_01370 [Staphylococcus delphini]VED62443.1 Uncharacterised protein [Staphylococcus delphini]